MKNEASWSHLDMICKGDAACLEQFKKVMKDELPKERLQLETAITQNDLSAAALLVHKIKHKFSLVEMTSAYNYAKTFEEELKSGNNVGHLTFNGYLDKLSFFLDH